MQNLRRIWPDTSMAAAYMPAHMPIMNAARDTFIHWLCLLLPEFNKISTEGQDRTGDDERDGAVWPELDADRSSSRRYN